MIAYSNSLNVGLLYLRKAPAAPGWNNFLVHDPRNVAQRRRAESFDVTREKIRCDLFNEIAICRRACRAVRGCFLGRSPGDLRDAPYGQGRGHP